MPMIVNAKLLAKLDRVIRPALASSFSPRAVVALYSSQRNRFLKSFFSDLPEPFTPPEELARTLWGLKFRSPLLNASGIFKNGEGYDLCFRQGAGAYLAGTVTALPREGNQKNGIKLPFAPYPRSHAASNWLGLPNDGDAAVSKRIAALAKHLNFPVGVSVAADPQLEENERLKRLIEGFRAYTYAGVDFIELNESCPNTAEDRSSLAELKRRLEIISEQFIATRNPSKHLPVIVKFSTDTNLTQVSELLSLLCKLKFDGVNFGNTSTDYEALKSSIDRKEHSIYRYFTNNFGGGVSGRPIKNRSLELVRCASEHLKKFPPDHEFHIIRTGGVETWADIEESLKAGASLVQWYTGYFEAFSLHGHELYKVIIS